MNAFAENPAIDRHERRRRNMVTQQLRASGIEDTLVLDAMSRIPREWFVPAELIESAYDDRALKIDCGQTISQPYIVARMSELLELRPTDRVLEIGAGSGYQTAVLATIAARVYSIERIAALAEVATKRLNALGLRNVDMHVGDGSLGWPEHAPYDAIIVTAGAPSVPQTLIDQLAEGGRLVAPVGELRDQHLIRLRRTGGRIAREDLLPCRFVPLIGEKG
ncbi:MAG: protein-L-isoaspartate(D-aspartate) O-methyltransferase [Phycisphaerales bacterium]|nr:protein-L-isoaspartate(D-aspartate) O-methyltransferase [Phycisphaerales bacterium]